MGDVFGAVRGSLKRTTCSSGTTCPLKTSWQPCWCRSEVRTVVAVPVPWLPCAPCRTRHESDTRYTLSCSGVCVVRCACVTPVAHGVLSTLWYHCRSLVAPCHGLLRRRLGRQLLPVQLDGVDCVEAAAPWRVTGLGLWWPLAVSTHPQHSAVCEQRATLPRWLLRPCSSTCVLFPTFALLLCIVDGSATG